jgi:hypothetical protein
MNIKYLNDTIDVVHHAVQLIAISGRFLSKPKEDDSHTAMEYSRTHNMMVGTKLEGDKSVRIALDIINLNLHILDTRLHSLVKYDLKDRKKEDGFQFLKKELMAFGLDTTLMKMETHFNIPDHPAGRGVPFTIAHPDSASLHAELRSVAKTTLQSLVRVFENTSEILIWPHHFDTGMIVYVDPDEKGKMRGTIGIGFAVHDSMVEEPYFYVNHWSDNDVDYPESLPNLDKGQWHLDNWKGVYLKISDFLDKDDNIKVDVVESFLSAGIDASIDLVKR